MKVVGIGVVAWAVPVGAVVAVAGRDSIFADQALFFTGAALITFGGAYAVLAYVAQQAVQVYGWLTPSEMITGLALAETTPGPLIMVVQFVAFVGAYNDPGSLNPWVAAVVASLLTTWVTFVPCFVFVFVGAPYVERLRGNHALSAALTGIMAAVVGVIANLAIYFAIHTLFRDVSTVHLGAGRPPGAAPGQPQTALTRGRRSSRRSCSSAPSGPCCAPSARAPWSGSRPDSSNCSRPDRTHSHRRDRRRQ